MKNHYKWLALAWTLVSLGLNSPVFGQALAGKSIKFSYQDKPLDLVFLDLKLNERLNFEFAPADVKDIRINLAIPRMPLEDALTYLLRGTGLTAVNEKYRPGFRLPAVPALKFPESVIVPAGWFRSGRIIELYEQSSRQIRLTQQLDRGSDFERCAFDKP